MSLLEKLVIQNKVRSEEFLTSYFIGIFIYLAIILVIFGLNFWIAGPVPRIILVAFTAFIHLHTLFLSPSLISMIFIAQKQSPIWERALIVAMVNIALCVVALTMTSYVMSLNKTDSFF